LVFEKTQHFRRKSQKIVIIDRSSLKLARDDSTDSLVQLRPYHEFEQKVNIFYLKAANQLAPKLADGKLKCIGKGDECKKQSFFANLFSLLHILPHNSKVSE
jgi:hypothetical protein